MDELTTFVASPTGRLLLEGPNRESGISEAESDTSSPTNNPVSVNLRLASDMKASWADQYFTHGSTVNSLKPSITLFGRLRDWSSVISLFFLIDYTILEKAITKFQNRRG